MEPKFDMPHREQYEKIEQNIRRVKAEITGDKTKEEIATLVEERERLIAELEAERSWAEDVAHEKNAHFGDEQRAQIDKLTAKITRYIVGITGMTEEEKERRREASIDDLTATIAGLKVAGYLDASFEGKESHRLDIRPFTKEQALAEYRASGGKTWIWDDESKESIPYTTPRVETLDIMILDLGDIGSSEAVALMDILGVRSLTYEELIQYGILNPEHQKKNPLVALGTKYIFAGVLPSAQILGYDDDGVRTLGAVRWDVTRGGKCRFPVVLKSI